ncbi:MAG: hypothetical protein M0P59_12210 [Gallionella sp.]|jgi:hypothetical protein|nr:hypothetical protein [Gallionella sp.]
MNLSIDISKIEWTKLVSALLLVFAGGYLPLLTDKPQGTTIALAALMAAFGGALLAEALKHKEQPASNIFPRINSINRLLATVTSKIGAIAANGLAEDANNLPAQKIGDLISILRTVVTDLSDITGQKFDPSALNETLDSIGRLITKLEQGEETPQEQAVISSLKNIYDDLQSKQTSKSIEAAKCPYSGCDSEVNVVLGILPASSAAATCPKCDKKFHVHRSVDGSVITREMKPTSKAKATVANA